MSTEWDTLCSDLCVLLEDKRDAEYKRLCLGTLLIHLLTVVEHKLEASPRNLQCLRELVKEHDPEYYELLAEVKLNAPAAPGPGTESTDK